MSNYEVQQDWVGKDAANAPVVAAEFGGEFTAIEAAIRTKADRNNTELTGIPTTTTPSGLVAEQIVNIAALTNRNLNVNFASLKSGGLVELFRVKSDTSFSAKTGAASGNNTNNAGYVFNGDNDSGLFNAENGVVSLAVNGVDRVTASTTALTVRNDLIAQSDVTIGSGQLFLQGNGGRILGVDAVLSGTDAANKNYVDAVDERVDDTNFLLDRLKLHNQVGCFVFARWNTAAPRRSSRTLDYGETVAGSELSPTNEHNTSSSTLPGQWRCLGYARNVTEVDDDGDDIIQRANTLFVRIS